MPQILIYYCHLCSPRFGLAAFHFDLVMAIPLMRNILHIITHTPRW